MSQNSAWSGARPHIDESELLCKTGCGFYGNPAWDGHCSKCYKELVQKQQQRKTVFDPTQIKNKVSQSVNDVSELQSKASFLMSRKFDKFDEKRRQQLDKKTRAVKSIFMKSQANRGTQEQQKEHNKVVRQLSEESQAAVTEFQEFFKTIGKEAQQLISKHIKNFMDKSVRTMQLLSVDELGDHVHEFYNNLYDLMAKHALFADFTQEQVERVGELTELYITTRLYKALIGEVNAFSEEKDLAIQKRIRSLMWVSPSHLECKVDENNQEVRSIMDEIITDLIEIDSKRVPSAKLKLLVSASHQVLNLLKMSSGGVPASADDFLPALIYCVIRANPPLLQSNICYITNFAQQSYLQSGEAGYFFTNLCCAVSFIEKLTADSLGLSQAEFDRYMSGDALPPNALEWSYMSDGMQLMQQTLDNFSELEDHLNKITNSYNKIVEEMEEFKDNLIEEVERVMERTPLTIRQKKANIDEPDPTQELLPPPLMPQCLKSEERMTEETASNLFLPFEEMKAPIQSLDSSADSPLLSSEILAAQKSLNFVQKLETPSQESCPSDIQVDYQSLVNLASDSDPFLQESITGASGYSHTFDPYVSLDSSLGSLHSQAEMQDVSKSPFCESEGENLLMMTPPPFNISKTLNSSRSPLPANPPPYTGFSIQGGRIPSIPCDTGFSHCMNDSLTALSPTLEEQVNLPSPMLPTSTIYPSPCESDDKEGDKKLII